MAAGHIASGLFVAKDQSAEIIGRRQTYGLFPFHLSDGHNAPSK
jgi:hypothetical protein